METRVEFKEILRLALPAIMTGIAEPLIGLVDTAIIGQVGTTDLGAVGLGSSFYLLLVWVFSQTRTAVSSIVSRALGNKTLETTYSLVPQAIWLNILLGLAIFALTVPFGTWIFSMYNATGEQLELCIDYYNIRAWGFPLTMSAMLIFGAFRGLQNTSWAMIISISAGLINLVLDVALVFGIEGFIDPMGVKGAAWASLSAQFFMLVMAVVFLLWRTPFKFFPEFKASPYFRQLMGMSINLMIRTIALNVAYFLSNRFAAGYGEKYLAAHTIGMQIWLFSAFFIDGFASAGNAISGRVIGAGNIPALRKLAWDLNKVAVVIATLLAGIYALGYFTTAEWFTDDPAVVEAFVAFYWLVIISQPINAIAFTFDGMFKGLGEAAYLRNTLLWGTLLGFVPIIYFCDWLGWQMHGVWTAFFIWMIIRGGSLVVKFNLKYREE